MAIDVDSYDRALELAAERSAAPGSGGEPVGEWLGCPGWTCRRSRNRAWTSSWRTGGALAAAPGVEDALDRNSWTDSYMVGEECEAFLDEEIARTEDIVEGLGR